LSKIVISIVGSAAILGSLVVAGVALSRKAGPGIPGASDLSSIESELSALREGMDGLRDEVRALRLAQESASGIRVPVPADAEAGLEGASTDALSATLPDYVAAVLAEERKLQEAERERQREERRVRMEERRKELETMREGPYDRYNVKVNSLAKVLGLTEAQARSYFDLVTAYNGKLEESMKQMREAREAERAAAATAGEGGQGQQDSKQGPGRGRRGDPAGRDQFRQVFDGLQKGFATDVASLLSAEQAQVYGELSRSAQSFQSTDMVGAPGESDAGRFAGFGGPGGGGRGGAGPGGGPPGGGGRRGR
jgi:outer membrane murein-binding lipoprotein Lpp